MDMFSDLGQEGRSDHEFLKNVRDKHVVHSVSPLEDNRVTVMLGPDDERRGVVSIGSFGSSLIYFGLDGVDQLERLATTVGEEVSKMIAAEKVRVLEIVRALPLDELYSLNVVAAPALTRDEAQKTRQRR